MRRRVLAYVLLCGLVRLAAERKAVLNAAAFARPGSPTCGIQEAMDALPPSGGVVRIPPGTHVMRRAIVLRSHVTLRGAWPTTILTRGKQAHAKLTQPARKGETSVAVDSTAGFRIGDEVALLDNRMRGWYMGHCIVAKVEPNRLAFVKPIDSGHKEGLFEPKRGAVAVNFFPFIVVADTTNTLVTGNRCGTDQKKPTQQFGIEESGKSDRNVFSANICAGNLAGGIAVVGKGSQLAANVGSVVRP